MSIDLGVYAIEEFAVGRRAEVEGRMPVYHGRWVASAAPGGVELVAGAVDAGSSRFFCVSGETRTRGGCVSAIRQKKLYVTACDLMRHQSQWIILTEFW